MPNLAQGLPRLATVIIPVKNGGARLEETLAAVFSQRADFSYDVLCVDSGSTDGSLDVLRRFPCTLVQIPPETYGHGRTRNMAIARARTPYVAMLTQDAVPANDAWLRELVQPLRDREEVAGVFGRHMPHPGCIPTEAYLLERFFHGFGQQVTTWQIRPGAEGWNEYQANKHRWWFFSDNNCALRRSVWSAIPYRDVEYLEDQLWARDVLEAGYAKAYAPEAVVRHSHDYQPLELFRRAFDESRYFRLFLEPGRYSGPLSWTRRVAREALADAARLMRDPQLGRGERLHWLPQVAARHVAHAAASYLGDRVELIPERFIRRLSEHHALKGDLEPTTSPEPWLPGARARLRQAVRSQGRLVAGARLASRVVAVGRDIRTQGITPALIGIKRTLRPSPPAAPSWWKGVPYRFMLPTQEPDATLADSIPEPCLERLTLNWVVPSFGRGSGGHQTLFRMLQHLERRGHRSRVYVLDATGSLPGEAVRVRDLVNEWFGPMDAPVHHLTGEMEPADIAIAGSWMCAYAVSRTRTAYAKANFIQDYEPLFYPTGAESALAEQSYRLGLYPITAGSWLQGLIQERFGGPVHSFPLAVEHRDYWPDARASRGQRPRLFAYMRPVTPRRAFELVALALLHVREAFPDVEVHTAGWELGADALPLPAVHHGILDARSLRRLFCSCDVGVCASLTNYSLMPQEMMACGLPVVDVDGENTRAAYPHGTVTLTETTPGALAAAIGRLLADPVARERQALQALAYARTLRWEDSSELVEAGLQASVRTEQQRRRTAAPDQPDARAVIAR